MKLLPATMLLLAGLATPAFAMDAKQEVAINRSSTTDQVSGLVVQGNAVVLVYGAPGMAAQSQAVRIVPDGNRLRITYDTVGNLGVNTAGLRPAMMMQSGGREFPVYNMGTGG